VSYEYKQLIAAVFAGGGNGYDIVDLLHKHNIKSYLLNPDKLKDGKYSHTELLICPFTSQTTELVAFINKTIKPGENVILIPSSSEFSLFLASNRNNLDKRFIYLQPEASLIETLDNKMLFYELCKKHNISCPKTFVVRNIGDFESIMNEITLPSIIKPFRSRKWPDSVGYKVIIARTMEKIRETVLGALSYSCEVIIQDMIPGGAKTDLIVGGLYDENSKPVKLYVGQKLLQHPLDIGIGCYVNLSWNQDAVNLANNFAKRTGYRGLVDIDIKYDPRDDSYKIIEVNPRNGLSHKISYDGHWDLLSFYVNWISGNKDIVKNFKCHEDGRKWIYPHEHLCSRIEESGLLKGVRLWFGDMRQARIRCAWNTHDIYRCYRYFRVVTGHVRRLSVRTWLYGRNKTV
jgi:D-aspartate ligase